MSIVVVYGNEPLSRNFVLGGGIEVADLKYFSIFNLLMI